MKKFSVLFSLMIVFITFAQKPIFAEAKLRSATLYEQSAELSSTASFKLGKGGSEIVITNVADDLDESSIKIGSKNKVSILTYRFSDDNDEYKLVLDKTNPQHKLVIDSIDLVKAQLSGLNFRKTALTKSLEILDKNQTINAGSTSFSSELSKLVDYSEKKRVELNIEIERLNSTIAGLTNRMTRLKTKFDINSKEKENYASGKIIIQVSSDTNETVDLDIKYKTNKASWRPFYDIVSQGMNSNIQLVYKALIQQNSGLDWKKIKLNLVSGFPNQNRQVPTLNSWELFYEQAQRDILSGRATGIKMKSEADESPQLEEVVFTAVKKTAFQNQLNVGYDLDDLYTILSNGQDNSITIDTNEIPAKYTYYTVPKLDKTVYLVAELENLDKYNLIAADANIVFENTNVGKTVLNPDTTDNKLLLTLGEDRRVSVKRELSKDNNFTKSLSSTNKEQQFSYEITVRNNKKEKINIRVKDQIPISTDKQIIVTMVNKNNAEFTDSTGNLTWSIQLGPNETKTIIYSYKVNYLKDKILRGL